MNRDWHRQYQYRRAVRVAKYRIAFIGVAA